MLERSSARETAARVAVGALCKVLLTPDIDIYSRVVEIGGIKDKDFYDSETFKANLDRNDVRVIDAHCTSHGETKLTNENEGVSNWRRRSSCS
ncbi:chorismate synthase [Staphylococcus aureus]